MINKSLQTHMIKSWVGETILYLPSNSPTCPAADIKYHVRDKGNHFPILHIDPVEFSTFSLAVWSLALQTKFDNKKYTNCKRRKSLEGTYARPHTLALFFYSQVCNLHAGKLSTLQMESSSLAKPISSIKNISVCLADTRLFEKVSYFLISICYFLHMTVFYLELNESYGTWGSKLELWL